MKCGSCGKKLNRAKYLIKGYKVNVINSKGEEVSSFPVCKDCADIYQIAQYLVEEYGEEATIDLLKEAFKKHAKDNR